MLDSGTFEELSLAKEVTNQILECHWKFYAELAHQRKQIQEDLLRIVNENSFSDFEFKGWQRTVQYKYGLHPLSTVGSLAFPGGRFNLGDINPNLPQ